MEPARQARPADRQAIGWDLVGFADVVMATGLRIGETAAITWTALDLDAEIVEARGTVVDEAGYSEITSHAFRRKATLMNGAGLSARAAADQPGHAKVSMTTDHYFGRKTRATGAAQVLEALGHSPQDEAPNNEQE